MYVSCLLKLRRAVQTRAWDTGHACHCYLPARAHRLVPSVPRSSSQCPPCLSVPVTHAATSWKPVSTSRAIQPPVAPLVAVPASVFCPSHTEGHSALLLLLRWPPSTLWASALQPGADIATACHHSVQMLRVTGSGSHGHQAHLTPPQGGHFAPPPVPSSCSWSLGLCPVFGGPDPHAQLQTCSLHTGFLHPMTVTHLHGDTAPPSLSAQTHALKLSC